MKLTVLIDNNTIIDQYLYGEPAVSYFIEDEDIKILFDAGYSSAFILNAEKLNIDIASINYLVLSHGHDDHTRGIPFLIEKLKRSYSDIDTRKRPKLLAHPRALEPKSLELDNLNIGVDIPPEYLQKFFSLLLTDKPYYLNNKFVFLGQIPSIFDFEQREAVGLCTHNNQKENDFLLDDSALVYKSLNGLVIITGCSHSGICNIIKYAQDVCAEKRIVDIIGGLHFLDISSTSVRISKTIDFLLQNFPEKMHPCHCTDLKSKIALSHHLPVCEVGSGMQFMYR
ncbi:MAG: MBL fold metallo-hydrolase [Oligoflexia bacterium]|nr:MBL fold metallo-hydrolase [Oligoflexia bacterium]